MPGEAPESREGQAPTSPPTGGRPPPSVTSSSAVERPPQTLTRATDSVWDRIKRHKVVEWTLAYLAFGYALLHGVQMLRETFEWPLLIPRLTVFVLLVGVPVAVTVAWYHGHRAQHRISGAELSILIALLLVGGSVLWWASRMGSTHVASTAAADATHFNPPLGDKSIAVLPFVDMSEKKDQEYFADGLAEEVLSLLATLPELKVISRTSSFQFKGHNADLRTVGAQLGAAYVVEGSVRRYGDRVRVTAQLISTQDGVHRWSDSYERDVGDLLRMQQDIATALGRALQVEVSAVPWQAAPTLTSTEAYNSYLHGLHAMDRYDKAGFEEAISYFEHALALDPSLSRARERLGQVHYLQLGFGFVTPTDGAERLRRDVDGILRENPRSGMGHALRSELLITYDWDWAVAQREAELGVSLAKNDSFALYAAGDTATALGHWDQADTLLRQALAVDPLDAEPHDLFSWMLYHAGRFAEAEAEGRRVLEIRPSYALAHFDLGLYLLAEGKLQAALSEMQLEPLAGFQTVGIAMAFHALRRKADSDAALRRAEHDFGQEIAYEIACAHAYRGEATAAFQWLDRAYAQKDFLLEYTKGEWMLRSLESDPRFKAFLRKMNLPE